MAFGLSFLPVPQGPNGETRDRAEPIQQAIKVLTLRLPRVLGGSAPAPAPLLQGGGSMGNPFAGSGPFQGRPIAPMPSPAPSPSPSPSSPSAPSPSEPYAPSGGGSPISPYAPSGGGSPISPGNPFNASLQDPMSRAILALAGSPAPPAPPPVPKFDFLDNPTDDWQPPVIGGPDRGTAPQPQPPPPQPPADDLVQPPPVPEPGPSPDNDLPRELAAWLYRQRGRGFEY
jgi:hypothetical protein